MIAISYDASRAKVSVMFGPTLYYYVRLSFIDYIQYSEQSSKSYRFPLIWHLYKLFAFRFLVFEIVRFFPIGQLTQLVNKIPKYISSHTHNTSGQLCNYMYIQSIIVESHAQTKNVLATPKSTLSTWEFAAWAIVLKETNMFIYCVASTS